MIVLLSQRRQVNKFDESIDSLELKYLSFFSCPKIFGSTPTLIPVPNHLKQAIRLFKELTPKILILTGGNNINPSLWGSSQILTGVSLKRDEVEGFLLKSALQRNIPILGVCRGAQFINVSLGGWLEKSKHSVGIPHCCEYEGQQFRVNSYHNYQIPKEGLAPGLQALVFSTTDSGVEAFAASNWRLLGIQWHPERPKTSNELFMKLIKRVLSPS